VPPDTTGSVWWKTLPAAVVSRGCDRLGVPVLCGRRPEPLGGVGSRDPSATTGAVAGQNQIRDAGRALPPWSPGQCPRLRNLRLIKGLGRTELGGAERPSRRTSTRVLPVTSQPAAACLGPSSWQLLDLPRGGWVSPRVGIDIQIPGDGRLTGVDTLASAGPGPAEPLG
jgi:hypothetical protein